MQPMQHVTVTPAYGRDYTSAQAAKADWKAGKDFILRDVMSPWDGKPCSIRDFAECKVQIQIRYRNLRRVCNA